LVEFNGEVFFLGQDRNRTRYPDRPNVGLMHTDGTPESTDYVVEPDRNDSSHYMQGIWDEQLHYQYNENRRTHQLYASDGTAAGTQEVDLPDYDSGLAIATLAVDLGDVLVGTVRSGISPEELAIFPKSTLTPEVVEVGSSPLSRPAQFFRVDDTAYFVADDGVHGVELWKTDGTTTGTKMLVDTVSEGAGSPPDWLTWFDAALYFSAGDAVWKHDPSTNTTGIVRQFNPFAASLGPSWFTIVDDTLYFVADGGDGDELWKTDGTTDGTVQVVDLLPGRDSSEPASLTALGNSLIFSARLSEIGNEIWVLDATTYEVQLLADLNPG